MIHILHRRLVDRHFADRGLVEALDPAALRAMFARTWDCARCRRRYERHLLFEAARPDGDAAHDERLWQAIASSAGASSAAVKARARTPWRAAVLTTSLAAAVAVALLAPRSSIVPTRSEPVARGVALEAPSAPSLHLYRTRDGRSAPVQDEIRSDDGILVAYSNPSSTLGYLMVFAVDHAGAVHWYYPGYERPGQDPAAVPIRTRALGVELGEEIRHELPRGDLKMFALFLPSPLRVLEVESLVARALAKSSGSVRALAGLELPPQGEQTSVLLEVRP